MVVMASGITHTRVAGRKGLDDYVAAALAASGTARHLREELECPLGRAEIWQIEADIGVHHPHERHLRKVQPLRHHLRAEQDMRFSVAEVAERLFVATAAAHRIAVHPRHARRSEPFHHHLLHSLGAGAPVLDARQGAPGTCFRRGYLVMTIMTLCPVRAPMEDEANVAMRASQDETAARARHVRVEPAPIQEQDNLFPFIEGRLNRQA